MTPFLALSFLGIGSRWSGGLCHASASAKLGPPRNSRVFWPIFSPLHCRHPFMHSQFVSGCSSLGFHPHQSHTPFFLVAFGYPHPRIRFHLVLALFYRPLSTLASVSFYWLLSAMVTWDDWTGFLGMVFFWLRGDTWIGEPVDHSGGIGMDNPPHHWLFICDRLHHCYVGQCRFYWRPSSLYSLSFRRLTWYGNSNSGLVYRICNGLPVGPISLIIRAVVFFRLLGLELHKGLWVFTGCNWANRVFHQLLSTRTWWVHPLESTLLYILIATPRRIKFRA